MNKEIKLIEIRNHLVDLERKIEYDTRAGHFNLNKLCEDLYSPILNIIYDYNLSNANTTIKRNYPAVDLVDFENSISIQVTSDKSGKKIKSTINTFIKNKEYEHFKKLKILIITKKQKNYSNINTKKLFIFDSRTDIIDIEDLYSIISSLEIDKFNKIYELIKKELDVNYKFVDLDQIKKPKEKVIDYFLTRKICKTSDYVTSLYCSEYKSQSLMNVLKTNNYVVILSDAGLGKSELCKDIVNKINQKSNRFSFYFKLIKYAGENIEDLKPKDYENLPNNMITFVLDGYDEIINSQKNIFIKKVQQFIANNKQAKVIISSRTNFYNCESKNFSGTIPNFGSYYLLPLNEDNLRDLATTIQINYKSFLTEIHKKNLINLIYNPFYAIELMTKFKSDYTVMTREKFIPYIIDKTFCIDVDKYNSTEDLNIVKNRIFQILHLLSIAFAMLEKNYISINELERLINNPEDRKLLNYTGVWKKENNNFYFLHNNFWEYLASEKLKELDLEKIKELVTYDSNNLNPNWLNILTFYLENCEDQTFIDWLLEIYPNFIFYLEKDKISENNRIELFKKTFEYYENKKIWLPNLIYYNDTFASFIFSNETVKFLITKLDKKNHYTVVFNALNLLFQFDSFGQYTAEIKNIMIKISCNSHYNTSQKRDAINILAKHKMLNDSELNKIIEANTSVEDAYLRAAYYFYLNENGVNTNNISILLNRLEKTQNYYHTNTDEDDEEVNLADEHMEFNKVFSNIKEITVFQIIIQTLVDLHRKECKETLNGEIIKNLCLSFEYLYRNKSANLDLLLKLYLILEENYLRREIEIIPKFLEKLDLKLEFFKKYMSIDEKKRFYDGNLIDEKCLKYFYDEYKKFNYSDETARIIIYSSSIQNEDYSNLNLLYFERTGYDIIAERKKSNNIRRIKKGRRTQDYFDAIFDKNNFILEIKKYLHSINLDGDLIDKDQIKLIEEDFYDDNDKYNYIIDFLRNFRRKEKVILLSDIEKIDWDYFIICESYNILREEKDINVSQEQKGIIERICIKYLEKFSFKNAIKYKSCKSISTSYLAIFTWYFRYKFNFNYPEDVLLDMLSFDWVTEEHQAFGIGYIEESVAQNKIKSRIVDNIKTQVMDGDVLKNHINYCIKNNIQDLSEYLIKYLLNKNLQFYEKDLIIDYILKDKGVYYTINELLTKTDYDTELRIIDKIFKIRLDLIIPFIERKARNSRNQDKKITYLKYLIKANNKYGISKYYELIKKSMQYIDVNHCYENSIKDALANVNDISLIDIISDIYLLTHDSNFKDNRFEGIYSGCRQSFINMAFSNLKNDSYNITLNKLENIITNNKDIKNIGFTNYIIDEIKERYLREKKKEKNIDEIVSEINTLFSKPRGLIY